MEAAEQVWEKVEEATLHRPTLHGWKGSWCWVERWVA